MLSPRSLLISGLLLGTLSFGRSASAQKYTLTDLGSLSAGTMGFESNVSSIGTAINNKGWVTGWAIAPHTYGIEHAFLWSDGTMHDLGTLTPKARTQGLAINNHGEVVGTDSIIIFGPGHGFLYSGGKMTDIGTMLGYPDAYAHAINDKGDIVGSVGNFSKTIVWPATGNGRGFVWHKGKMTSLGTLPGATDSGAHSINKWGQLTGGSGGHIFLYDKGKIADLGCLPGLSTVGTAINDKGEIVGITSLVMPNGILKHNVVLYRNHTLTAIGASDDMDMGQASINNKSQIVASAGDIHHEHSGRGCIYSAGRWIDLNDLLEAKSGWTIEEANGINDSGLIVGSAQYFGPGKLNGVVHAVLLTPVKGTN